ncbi:MAG TPA: nitroreductase family protein [Ktedonobacterales bacterium]
MGLDLTPDQLLSTTRSVRKRLDFTRPVEPEIIRECLELAMQAPTGGNGQRWRWMVVTDEEKRRALGDIYRRGFTEYKKLPINQRETLERLRARNPERAATQDRVIDSSDYLAETIHQAPALVIPCHLGRVDGADAIEQAGFWGSILPAAWSFMLALRARGLGSAWTTLHLWYEEEAAELLGIPYKKVTQCALLPVAYTLGTDFKPARREPLESVVYWESWRV